MTATRNSLESVVGLGDAFDVRSLLEQGTHAVAGWTVVIAGHGSDRLEVGHGATSGFEMFAARYTLKRFSRKSVPAAQHMRRWKP